MAVRASRAQEAAGAAQTVTLPDPDVAVTIYSEAVAGRKWVPQLPSANCCRSRHPLSLSPNPSCPRPPACTCDDDDPTPQLFAFLRETQHTTRNSTQHTAKYTSACSVVGECATADPQPCTTPAPLYRTTCCHHNCCTGRRYTSPHVYGTRPVVGANPFGKNANFSKPMVIDE